jgi:hypothetical protein
MRAAHLRDGAAMVEFLSWFDSVALSGQTEIDMVRKLEALRAATGALVDLSFDTIAGTASAPENGAVYIDKNGIANDEEGYDAASGRFAYFGPGPFVGQEYFLMPKAEYRYGYNTPSAPSLGLVGTRRTPPSAPSLRSGQTWLLTAVVWRRQGGIRRVTEIYKASGQNGWNTTIYP